MLHGFFAWVARRSHATAWHAVQGAIVAITLATWCLRLAILLGTSLPASLAMMAALALGFATGAHPVKAIGRLRSTVISTETLLSFLLAAWMVASPWLAQIVDWAIAQPGVFSFTSTPRNALAFFVLATLMLCPPAFIAAQLSACSGDDSTPRVHKLKFFFLGAAVEMGVWGLAIAPFVGAYYCGILAAGLGLVLAAVRSYRHGLQGADTPDACEDKESANERSNGETEIAAERSPIEGPARWKWPRLITLPGFPSIWRLAGDGVVAIGCGGLLAALGRLLAQLMPGSVYLSLSIAVGLCAGLAAGLFLIGRRKSRGESTVTWRLLAVSGFALFCVGVLTAFPLLTEAALWLNASVSSSTLLILARGAVAGFAVFPLGAAAAIYLAPPTIRASAKGHLGTGAWQIAAMIGYCVVSAWAVRHFPLEQVIIGSAWLIVAAVEIGRAHV